MTPANLLTLETRLSADRLGPYRAAVGGDLGKAVELYEWNRAMSAAFGATLADLEVIVRNSMHDQLTAWSTATYGEPLWYLDPGKLLNDEATKDIAKARFHRELARSDVNVDDGVLADLRAAQDALMAAYELVDASAANPAPVISEPTVEDGRADAAAILALLDELRAERLRLGISLDEAARRMGVTLGVLNDFELGRRERPASVLLHYARVLGGTVSITFQPGEVSRG